VPVLIDRNANILAGHGRVRASQRLGLHEVPVIRIEHLSEAQAKAFRIADNRLTDNSVWDDRLLAGALKELSDLELDFSIEATGFEMGEIDFRIETLDGDANVPDGNGDAPQVAGPAVCQAGDLWLLNGHRLYCGNALDARAYEILMQGKRAAMVFCDPPYNERIDGHVSGLGQVHHREFAMASGEMSEAEFTAFLTLSCTLLARNSTEGSIHFICTDWRRRRKKVPFPVAHLQRIMEKAAKGDPKADQSLFQLYCPSSEILRQEAS